MKIWRFMVLAAAWPTFLAAMVTALGAQTGERPQGSLGVELVRLSPDDAKALPSSSKYAVKIAKIVAVNIPPATPVPMAC